MGAKKASGKLIALLLLIALISASLTIAFAETDANTNSQAIDVNSNEIERNAFPMQDNNNDLSAESLIIYVDENKAPSITGTDYNFSPAWQTQCSYSNPQKLCDRSSSANQLYWTFYDCWNNNKISEGTKCLNPYPEYTCTDWVYCPNGHSCFFYYDERTVPSCTPCTDECSQEATRCINSWYRETCGNYDSDTCYEWGNQTYCQYGCASGQCNSTQPCTDECSFLGQKQCNGSNKQECGNYDSDNCLEWQNTNCPDGCERGECRTCTSHYTAKCASGDIYWFDSCDRQQELKEDCRVSCEWNSTDGYYCSNGCKANWKIYAFDIWRNGKANTTIQYDLRDSTGWQFAGQTNSSGLLEFSKIIPYGCGRGVNIKAISAEGALCGENWGFVEKENDTDTLFFNCPWALTLNGLVVSINTDKSTYTQGENVSLSIRVSDWFGNPVQGAFIGIILPDGSKATASTTNSSGNSTYTFTASGTGNQKITVIANKVGYWAGYGETRFTVKEKPKIVIEVIGTDQQPIPNATIYVNGVPTATTNSQGKAVITVQPRTNTIEVKSQDGASCGTKTMNIQGASAATFRCMISSTGNMRIKIRTQNNLPIANVYIYLDDEFKGLTNHVGIVDIANAAYGNHRLDLALKIADNEDETPYDRYGSFSINFSTDYQEFTVHYSQGNLNIAETAQITALGDENVSATIAFIPAVVAIVIGGLAVLDFGDYSQCVTQKNDFWGSMGEVIWTTLSCGSMVNFLLQPDCADKLSAIYQRTISECQMQGAFLAINFIPMGTIVKGAKWGIEGVDGAMHVIPHIDDTYRFIKGVSHIDDVAKFTKGGEEIVFKYIDNAYKLVKGKVFVIKSIAKKSETAEQIFKKIDDMLRRVSESEIPSSVSSKADNIKGFLGEKATDEYISVIKKELNAEGAVVDLIGDVRNAGKPWNETTNYIFKYNKTGGIDIVQRGGDQIGEIDRLIKVNDKIVIFESKTSKTYWNIVTENIPKQYKSMDEYIIKSKINPIAELTGESPEFVLLAPTEAGKDIAKDQWIKTVILDPLKKQGVQATADNFPQTAKEFDDVAQSLCARLMGCIKE